MHIMAVKLIVLRPLQIRCYYIACHSAQVRCLSLSFYPLPLKTLVLVLSFRFQFRFLFQLALAFSMHTCQTGCAVVCVFVCVGYAYDFLFDSASNELGLSLGLHKLHASFSSSTSPALSSSTSAFSYLTCDVAEAL